MNSSTKVILGGNHLKANTRIYPNGFIFTENDIDETLLPTYYSKRKIVNKYNYYYDEQSESRVYKLNGNFIIIHGLFAHIDLDEGDISSESPQYLMNLYLENRDEFYEALDFLAGRFVLIIGDKLNFEVFTDAGGMRTVFYVQGENTVGSHLNFLGDIFTLESDCFVELNENFSVNWDTTVFSNVKSINPNFSYNSESDSVSRYFPRKTNIYRNMSEEEKFSKFEFLWKEQLRHFEKENDDIIFSVTGGADSRVSLALAKNYLSKFKFFTYAPSDEELDKKTHFIEALTMDKKIVEKILEVIPLQHQFLLFMDEKRKLTEEELDLLNKNTIRPHGRFLLPHYNHYFPGLNTLHIRGNLFEIGRAYFIKPTSKNSKKDIVNLVFRPLMKTVDKDSKEESDIRENIEDKIQQFNYDQNNNGYHVLDLFYWEIRMGRWMAEVLNETDFSFETLLPFNMRALMDISLSFKVEQRRNNYMFDELINRNFPVLNFFGKNELENLFEKSKLEDKNKIFEEMKVVTKAGETLETINVKDNTIFVPANKMGNENFSQVVFKYTKRYGNLLLTLRNSYANRNAENYLKYIITVNGQNLLSEDIAFWSQPTDITITGLKAGDEIMLQLVSLKNSNTQSWQTASMTEVINYKEVPYKHNMELNVFSNSPFAQNTK